jgi:hypothetical protein
MQRPTSSHPPLPPLARAFLALGDADAPAHGAPSLGAVLASLAAAAVLALSAPLAVATAPVPKASDQPTATAASKAGVPSPDDDGGDGGA